MKFYQYGNANKPIIMLLPSTCCHWSNNYSNVIDILSKQFFVLCVSYDGFDPKEESQFQDVVRETEKIENYLIEQASAKVYAVYGSAIGGTIVNLLVQRGKIYTKHAIVGSPDISYESRICAIIHRRYLFYVFYKMLHQGKVSKRIRKSIIKHIGEDAYEKLLHLYGIESGQSMKFVSKQSIRNQCYTDGMVKLHKHVRAKNTNIHCFYSDSMGKKVIERYEKYYRKPEIITSVMPHEVLLQTDPEKWVEDVCSCFNED